MAQDSFFIFVSKNKSIENSLDRAQVFDIKKKKNKRKVIKKIANINLKFS